MMVLQVACANIELYVNAREPQVVFLLPKYSEQNNFFKNKCRHTYNSGRKNLLNPVYQHRAF